MVGFEVDMVVGVVNRYCKVEEGDGVREPLFASPFEGSPIIEVCRELFKAVRMVWVG